MFYVVDKVGMFFSLWKWYCKFFVGILGSFCFEYCLLWSRDKGGVCWCCVIVYSFEFGKWLVYLGWGFRILDCYLGVGEISDGL